MIGQNNRLKEYRIRIGMKQSELAKKVGVQRETITRLENGQHNSSLKLALDIAKLLGVTIEELFGSDLEAVRGKVIPNENTSVSDISEEQEG